jgi:hypothetical protein
LRPLPSNRVGDGFSPAIVDRRSRTWPEPDVVLQHQDVVGRPGGDHLPDFDVRASDGYLLPGHSYRFIDIEGVGEADVRLYPQLVTDAVGRVNVSSGCDSATVTGVHGGESPSHLGQRQTIRPLEPTQLTDQKAPPVGLTIQVDDDNGVDLTRAVAEYPEPFSWDSRHKTTPSAEDAMAHRPEDIGDVHSPPAC